MKKRRQNLEKDFKKVKKERKTEIIVVSLAVISIIGFAFSLFFLAGITGAAVGNSRSNLVGLIVIVVSLLLWTIAELMWVRNKKKQEIDVKKLLKDLEKEGFPLVYRYTNKSG
jgi:uncharacterized membrane protein YbhN (UPF0104 family)